MSAYGDAAGRARRRRPEQPSSRRPRASPSAAGASGWPPRRRGGRRRSGRAPRRPGRRRRGRRPRPATSRRSWTSQTSAKVQTSELRDDQQHRDAVDPVQVAVARGRGSAADAGCAAGRGGSITTSGHQHGGQAAQATTGTHTAAYGRAGRRPPAMRRRRDARRRRGCAICRMPMASPRRPAGNQPTTTRPLATLLLAAASAGQPERRARAGPTDRAAPRASPSDGRAHQPGQQHQPLAAAVGDDAPRRPGRASRRPSGRRPPARPRPGRAPRWSCSAGMRNAGPCTITAVDAWASVLAAEHRPAPADADRGGAVGDAVPVTPTIEGRRQAPVIVGLCVAALSRLAGVVRDRSPSRHDTSSRAVARRVSDRDSGPARSGRGRRRGVGWGHGHLTPHPPLARTGHRRRRRARARGRRRRRAGRRAGGAAATRRWPRSTGPAAVVEELAAAPTPAYGISTGFGALATRHIPTEMRAQLQRSLVRSHAAGSGPEVEREVVRGADAAAALDAGDRAHRRPPRDRAAAGRPAQRTASRRSCTSTARSAAPATSPRSSHCALALMGEGDGPRRGRRAGAGRRGARRRRARRRSSWRPRRGSR